MRNLIEVLEEVIHPIYKMDTTGGLTISEENVGAKNREVKLRKTGQAYALSLDNREKDPYPFFQDREGLKLKSDAIVFSRQNNKTYVFLIELKSNQPAEAIPQLRVASYFVDYVLAVIQLKYPQLSLNIEKRGIVFHTRKNTNKRPDHRESKANYKNISGLPIAFVGSNQGYGLDYFAD